RLSDLEAVGDSGSQARGLAQGLLADTATRILYNEPYDEARAAGTLLGLTSVEVDQLPELAQGEGLWRVNERAFVVRHLLTAGELALFDTDRRMVGR
ncbi:MAG: ATP-binding protein, partial [Actinomycetota bacterium]|nr:ATP-binding protein [Actinomycetota bacterium]